MTSAPCELQRKGSVELFFYEELDPAARAEMAAHVGKCPECAAAFDELKMIRQVLAAHPEISAPREGDWTRFMQRLDAAVASFDSNGRAGLEGRLKPATTRARRYVGLLATAALLAIVMICILIVARGRSSPQVDRPSDVVVAEPPESVDAALAPTTGLKSVGEQHFERSKLVVLGLAAKEPDATPASDWAYERELATSLLNDTRLYRLAAEERGLASLAGVMRDLELVLLETSMAQESDGAALGHIQQLIRKRGLIGKMDAVATAGM